MESRDLTCEACGETFAYSEEEQARDESQGYPPPRLCGACRQARRGEKATARAARRPRKRGYRR